MKVRIDYYGSGYYIVQYKKGGWFTFWKTMYNFLNLSDDGRLDCWNPILLSVEEAEEFAKTLKTIEDVNEFYAKEKIKQAEANKRTSEYRRKQRPFGTKTIQ